MKVIIEGIPGDQGHSNNVVAAVAAAISPALVTEGVFLKNITIRNTPSEGRSAVLEFEK